MNYWCVSLASTESTEWLIGFLFHGYNTICRKYVLCMCVRALFFLWTLYGVREWWTFFKCNSSVCSFIRSCEFVAYFEFVWVVRFACRYQFYFFNILLVSSLFHSDDFGIIFASVWVLCSVYSVLFVIHVTVTTIYLTFPNTSDAVVLASFQGKWLVDYFAEWHWCIDYYYEWHSFTHSHTPSWTDRRLMLIKSVLCMPILT